jgi:hypothetical protein
VVSLSATQFNLETLAAGSVQYQELLAKPTSHLPLKLQNWMTWPRTYLVSRLLSTSKPLICDTNGNFCPKQEVSSVLGIALIPSLFPMDGRNDLQKNTFWGVCQGSHRIVWGTSLPPQHHIYAADS